VSAFAAGLGAALRSRRLAGVLWLSLLGSSLLAWFSIKTLFVPLDEGAFREALVKGWNGWAFLSFLWNRRPEIGLTLAAVWTGFFVFALLTIFLTGGVLRALIAGRPRPVFRLVVAESAALFKANLWATLRFALAATLWIGILVAAPAALLAKLGKDAPPHTFLPELRFWWILIGSAIVLLNVGLRFDLARVALARGEAVNARGAFRVAKRRIRGGRASVILLALLWLAIAAAIQAFFTAVGLRWNPQTDASTFGLFVFRQLGFFVLAMARVGFWASLLAWEDARRPPPSLYGV
jgi:hypothetical protein